MESSLLPPDKQEHLRKGGYVIESTQAFVASGFVSCQLCEARTEVICIYCKAGDFYGEPFDHEVTVSAITRMDESLQEQLKAWPNFHTSQDEECHWFQNFCRKCKKPQCEFQLHFDSDGPFRDLIGGPPTHVKCIPLNGKVGLDGAIGFKEEWDEEFEDDEV